MSNLEVGTGSMLQVMVCDGAKPLFEKLTALTMVRRLAWVALQRVRRGENSRKALVGSRTRERPREQESSTGARSAWEEPARGERIGRAHV